MKANVLTRILAVGLMLGGQVVFGQMASSGHVNPDSIGKTANEDPIAMSTDRLFVKTAFQGGLAEIQLGTLAGQKSGNSSVKELGQKLVDDHTGLNTSLKMNAQAMGIGLADKPSKKDLAEYNKLNGLSGAEFDKEFLAYVVKDHKKDLSDYQDEDGKTPNQDLKGTVDKGIQMISMHLQMAQKLEAAQ